MDSQYNTTLRIENIAKAAIEKEAMDEKRHNQIMSFMTSFQSNMELNIKETNQKLDTNMEKVNAKIDDKMEEINGKMNEVNEKIDANDKKSEDAMSRMDERLKDLEEQMKKSVDLKKKREILRNEDEKKNKALKEEVRKLEEKKKKKAWLEAKDKIEKRKFERREITEKDLAKEVEVEERQLSSSNYKSSWAAQMEIELALAAGNSGSTSTGEPTKEGLEDREEVIDPEEEEEEVLDTWERLAPQKTVDRRKTRTVAVTKWMEEEPNMHVLSSSSEDENDGKWSSVERKKKNLEKMKERKKRKKMKMTEIATKMRHTIGIGPIDDDNIRYFEEREKDKTLALKNAVTEYLRYFLDFNDEEIAELEILDVRRTGKDDVTYVVFKDTETIREIYYRKAISENRDLVVRDYIPPNYYARYAAVAKQAAEKRAKDKTLKTQLRWGEDDIEIFIKHRDNEEQFKKTNLKEFMEKEELPEFDMDIKWERRDMKHRRRKLDFGKSGRPSTRKEEEQTQKQGDRMKLARQRSNQGTGELSKKFKEGQDQQEMDHDDLETRDETAVVQVEEDELI